LPTLRRNRYHGGANDESIMLLKTIAFIAAVIPLVLFVRAMFFRRPNRISEGVREFRKQVDVAVWIFLGLVGCVVAFAVGKLLWTWWTTL
jgi:fumarate reductase subunit D